MNTLVMILYFGNIACFIASLFLFLNPLKSNNQEKAINNWKLHLLLIIISSIFFFTFFTATMQSIGRITTISDGVTEFKIQENNYLEATLFLQLVSAMYATQIAFFIAGIIKEFELLGRTRFKG